MKILYPESLDIFNLRRSRIAKNSATQTTVLEPDDLVYAVNELERKMGANASTDPSSIDFRVSALNNSVDTLQAAIAGLIMRLSALESSATAGAIRARRAVVATGGTPILFSSPLPSEYVILGACYNGNNEMTGFIISGQTSEGFTVVPDEDGTFDWIAVAKQ